MDFVSASTPSFLTPSLKRSTFFCLSHPAANFLLDLASPSFDFAADFATVSKELPLPASSGVLAFTSASAFTSTIWSFFFLSATASFSTILPSSFFSLTDFGAALVSFGSGAVLALPTFSELVDTPSPFVQLSRLICTPSNEQTVSTTGLGSRTRLYGSSSIGSAATWLMRPIN